MVPKNISPPGDGYGVDKIDKMNGFPNKQLYKDGELEHMGKPIPYGLPPVNGYNKQDVDGFNGDDDDAYDQIRPNGHKLHRNAATKSLAVSGAGTLVIVSSMVFGVAFSSNSLSLF
ncbi:hypothetical protein H4219_000468 [Mycoemilia scoparia]|uniref:Uncharacterized protein n=1 Tax=Mycoemilia scoparia TaxID=417184 RepID=A0A9W8A2V5_9FUNG|nr:hypothetical protein H4219_000468 [Mycoemilia scoparia]